jgi:hypothetical protein
VWPDVFCEKLPYNHKKGPNNPQTNFIQLRFCPNHWAIFSLQKNCPMLKNSAQLARFFPIWSHWLSTKDWLVERVPTIRPGSWHYYFLSEYIAHQNITFYVWEKRKRQFSTILKQPLKMTKFIKSSSICSKNITWEKLTSEGVKIFLTFFFLKLWLNSVSFILRVPLVKFEICSTLHFR